MLPKVHIPIVDHSNVTLIIFPDNSAILSISDIKTKKRDDLIQEIKKRLSEKDFLQQIEEYIDIKPGERVNIESGTITRPTYYGITEYIDDSAKWLFSTIKSIAKLDVSALSSLILGGYIRIAAGSVRILFSYAENKGNAAYVIIKGKNSKKKETFADKALVIDKGKEISLATNVPVTVIRFENNGYRKTFKARPH